MILVDASVWISHLRVGDPALASCLDEGMVLMHPFVIGELACNDLRHRWQLLPLWRRLPQALQATDAEVLYFMEQKKLMGQGLGWVDMHLLASTVLSGARGLWTRDVQLARAAESLGCFIQPDDPRGNLHEPTLR